MIFIYRTAVLLAVFLLAAAPVHAAKNTREAESLKNQGNALYMKGNVDGAIELWRKAIKADSTYSEAYNNLGVAFYEKGEYAQSIENLCTAVMLDRKYEKAFNSLGNSYLAVGEYDSAKVCFERSISLKGRSPRSR